MPEPRTTTQWTEGAEAGEAGERAVDAVRALARLSRVLERASEELSLGQYRVLAAVASGDERASRVARRLALGKPTVSAAVESLARRGLLVRTSDASDQRAAALEVTREGRELLDRVERAMGDRLGELLDATPDPVCSSRALRWLAAAVDEVAARREGR